jgi:hypothetical protein
MRGTGRRQDSVRTPWRANTPTLSRVECISSRFSSGELVGEGKCSAHAMARGLEAMLKGQAMCVSGAT